MNLVYIPHNGQYEIMVSSECPYYDEQTSTVNYNMDLKYLKIENGYHLVELKKYNLLLNNEETQEAFNDILIITSEAINKVVLKISSHGQVLGLANYEEIKSKWFEIRPKVEETYQGEYVSEYLDKMASKLSSQEMLWKALSRDFFFTAIFNRLYIDYGRSNTVSEDLLIRDLLPTQAVGATVTKTLNTHDGYHEIIIIGTEYFEEFVPATIDFFGDDGGVVSFPKSAVVSVSSKYKVDLKSTAIMNVDMEVALDLQSLYQKKMSIQITKI